MCVMGEGLPPLVHASDAGKLDERPEGVTEVMSTDPGVPPQAPAVIQGFLVPGDNIHGCGAACACGVEVGLGRRVAVAVAAAVEAAIVAAVEEGTGAEPGGLALVDRGASPHQDM